MSRLLRLAAAALVLAAARPAFALPTEPELIAAAKEQVAAGCGRAKDACPLLKKILDGYLLSLKTAEQCLTVKCAADTALWVFRADEVLDKAESELPDPAHSALTGERPLLRLSLLVSYRAASALALADPAAKPPIRFNPAVDGPKAVESACLTASAVCADARAALDMAKKLDEETAACEKKKCSFEELDGAAARTETAMGAYERASRSGNDMLTLFALINAAHARLAALILLDANENLAGLNAGLGGLEKGVAAFAAGAPGADQFALEAQVGELGRSYRAVSLNADRLAAYSGDYNKTGISRASIGDAAVRLAAARARLVAAETARGLSPSAPSAGAVAGFASGAPRAALSAAAGVSPTLLDRRTIPKPPPLDPKAPPILSGEIGLADIARNLFSDDPVKRADARRRVGLSYTVGDPAGRAPLVHTQQYKDTCALVSQQEVLASLHLLATADQNKAEDELRAQARRRGFYNEGTPDAYTADLLVDRGVLVAKRNAAPIAELDAAVRRGGLVIANVDARYLWDKTAVKKVLGHAILITGAEVERTNGRTIGYYVNDSGTDPPGRSRFVPIDKFQKSWEHHTRSFAEVR